MSGVDLPSVDRIVIQQACVEEARALLAEASIALSRIALLTPLADSGPMVAEQKARAKVFHRRAMTRLQEAFYPADDA